MFSLGRVAWYPRLCGVQFLNCAVSELDAPGSQLLSGRQAAGVWCTAVLSGHQLRWVHSKGFMNISDEYHSRRLDKTSSHSCCSKATKTGSEAQLDHGSSRLGWLLWLPTDQVGLLILLLTLLLPICPCHLWPQQMLTLAQALRTVMTIQTASFRILHRLSRSAEDRGPDQETQMETHTGAPRSLTAGN